MGTGEHIRSRLLASEHSRWRWLSHSVWSKWTERIVCHDATCPQRFAERSRSTKRSDRTFQSHGESSTGSGCREDRVVIGLDWCTLKSTNPDDLMDLKSLQD
jgi:hypothetical protein